MTATLIRETAPPTPTEPRKGWITDWRPDDEEFWRSTGRKVARRNLVFSVITEHLGFSVWTMFSIIVPYLAAAGFGFTTGQLFGLVAVPNLVGAFLRIPYTFAVGVFGGRNWTIVSAGLLVLPTGLLAWAVQNPGTPYWVFVLCGVLAGFGGGNFASSMANISYFYPERHRGAALGVNAAGGNIGVAVVQLAGPFVIAVGLIGASQGAAVDGSAFYLHNVPLLWMALAIAAAFLARRYMNNLSVAKTTVKGQLPALKRKHTWIMSVLYIGTFGSFIGFSFAFPLMISIEFPAFASIWLAALGPLIGSLARPFGGWLSDRTGGGAPITGTCFVLMSAGVLGAVSGVELGSFWLFFASFMALFVLAGLANGSAYRSIPAIFQAEAGAEAGGRPTEEAVVRAKRLTAAALGWISFIGALGGFAVNQVLRVSNDQTGSMIGAMYVFAGSYLVFFAINWWFYQRRVFVLRAPSLAYANV
ncbi:MFS transporter [Glycomyces xiaoerkulensis]|uniref:MFS transporter n=1 Tax=Glycomyces xiaoerkulensis TaxID=2038139 RepID=UPI000C25EEF0|nr:MFS transporter [Glycomyces xiaoerkulensis]